MIIINCKKKKLNIFKPMFGIQSYQFNTTVHTPCNFNLTPCSLQWSSLANIDGIGIQ